MKKAGDKTPLMALSVTCMAGMVLIARGRVAEAKRAAAFVQRVIAAKVIRRWIVNQLGKIAMVIEHDFVMASALSDKVVVYDGEPGVECTARAPVDLVAGFNSFLQQLDVTFRRDPANARPRVNKPGSQNDQDQKASGNLFTFDGDVC